MDILLVAIVVLGLIFDYTNGFHDAANVVATVIATRVLAPLSAIVMAASLNFLGATQISGVAQTIATGIVEPTTATQIVILAAVFAAILWNLITWYFGIPSSSSYALIGGLIGAAYLHAGIHTIFWHGVLSKVILPMFITPVLGFSLSFFFMKMLYYTRAHHESKLFRHLQIGSACFVALAHGLNDAQKSMGIITLGLFTSGYITSTQIPTWVIFACALMMGLGTATGGFRIIRTLAYKITNLAPVQGFAAETSSSLVILSASFLGMPVSSTHMITGSIAGVGAAKRLSAVEWGTPQKLLFAWILTLPGAAITGAIAYKIFSFNL